ncbi:MAG: type II secretion system F family protein [Patescibacteria group bacterium]
MKFNYLARSKEGQIQKGIVEASSEEAALTILQKYGLYVTALEMAKPAPIYAKQIRFLRRVSQKDIVAFARQLSILFKSQVPIVEALLSIARQTEKLEFREKVIRLAEEVEGGTTLSSAFSLYPKLFSPFFINMVKSGEASGKLSEALEYLADHLEQESDFQSKITGAMIYPAFVVGVFVLVFVAMIFFVMPRLIEILQETNQELPLVTKIVIAFTNFIRKWGAVLLVAVIASGLLLYRYIKTEEGKKFLDRNILKIPIVGPLLKKVYLTRFAENISTLISGGLPIARALEISGEVVGNDVYRTIIFDIRDGVRKGESISSVLENYQKEFPSLFVQMTVVGEKTGRIETVLGNIVNFYKKEVDRSVDSMIALLEPLMLVVLGVGVALLLVSILLPIYQIGAF